VDGPAAEGILAAARERHAILIAMTTHGRGGLSRLVVGSVAETVLREAPCPMLLVRVGVGGQRAADAASAEGGGPTGRDRTAQPPRGQAPRPRRRR
jgi:hypothetical protein